MRFQAGASIQTILVCVSVPSVYPCSRVGHSTQLKRLGCDSCDEFMLTEATMLEDGSRAILAPAGWRLIWKGPKITFRCPKCWRELPTGEFKLSEFDGGKSMTIDPVRPA